LGAREERRIDPRPMPDQLADLLTNMGASGVVGASCVGLLNPLDTMRIRFQVSGNSSSKQACSSNSSNSSSLLAFTRDIARRQGVWRGLWRPGLGANMTSICFSTGFRLGLYPTLRDGVTRVMGAEKKNALAMWLSGLVPGLVSYWCITPLYLVKTQMQISAGDSTSGSRLIYRNTLDGLRTIAKQPAGLRQLYRGAVSLMARGGLISSGQTLGYDMAKTQLGPAGAFALLDDGPVLHTVAGCCSAAGATAFGMPCDVLFTNYSSAKQRGVQYAGLLDCTRTLLREQGPLGFYRGSMAFFLRSSPIFIMYFPIYEQVRKLLGMGYMT
jgi:hypothetical protein